MFSVPAAFFASISLSASRSADEASIELATRSAVARNCATLCKPSANRSICGSRDAVMAWRRASSSVCDMLGGRIAGAESTSAIAGVLLTDEDAAGSRERLVKLAKIRACSGSSSRLGLTSGVVSGSCVASGNASLSLDLEDDVDEDIDDGVFRRESQERFSSCNL